MAPRPSSKKWGEKKINADTRNTLDSPIEMVTCCVDGAFWGSKLWQFLLSTIFIDF